jgi:excisionase family DNA binding protein
MERKRLALQAIRDDHGAMTIPELEGKLTIDVQTAARLLGISPNAAYRAVHAGEIPSLRLGQRIVIPISKFLKMLGAEDDEPPVIGRGQQGFRTAEEYLATRNRFRPSATKGVDPRP